MTSRIQTLVKQAQERWKLVPKEEQTKLIEELATKQPGTAVIELNKPTPLWKNGMPTGTFHCQARIVSILFGMDIGMDIVRGSSKRYLCKSDIPEEQPTEPDVPKA